jgi:hypothetical protein
MSRRAAPVLVGWILLLPPTNGKNVTLDAPLVKWKNAGVYDSAEERRNVIERMQSGIKARESETRLDAAQCVTSDDARLKAN